MRALAIVLLFAGVVAACGGAPSTPPPTQASMDDVIALLVLRGLTIHRAVSGDPGCPSSELHSNAVRLEVSIDARSATHDIYLFRWRRSSDFVDSAKPYADCIAEFQALNGGRAVSQVESEPWRAYGPGWPEDLAPRLQEALDAAGGT
jgi:hypothetical protein